MLKGWKLQDLTLGGGSSSAYPSKISYEYSFANKEYMALGTFANLSFEPEYISFLYGSEKSDKIKCSWRNQSIEKLTSRPNPPSIWGEIKIKNSLGKKIDRIGLYYYSLKKKKRGSFSFNGSLGISLQEEISPSGEKELRRGSSSWSNPPYKSSVRGNLYIKKNRIFYELIGLPGGKYLFWASVNDKTLAYPRAIMIDNPHKEGFTISLDKGASLQCLLVDESGKALSEMRVYLTLLDITGNEYKIFSPPRLESKTDKKGYLKISGLAPGLYKITGSAKVKYGWRIFQEGINLRLKDKENYQGKLTVPLKK